MSRITNHFPKMIISQTRVKKDVLNGRESVDEYLARGGSITKLPYGVKQDVPSGKKLTQGEKMRMADYAKGIDAGKLVDKECQPE
jgi:hypothetical protein